MDTTSSSVATRSLVHKRIQDVLIAHESTLSNLSLSSLEHRKILLLRRQEQREQRERRRREARKNSSLRHSPYIESREKQEGGSGSSSTSFQDANETNKKGEEFYRTNERHDENVDDEQPLPSLSFAQAALYRTFQSQPPFQKTNYHHNCDPNNNLIIDLNLNPPERVSPQDLLIHDKRRPTNPLDLTGGHHHHHHGAIGGGGGLGLDELHHHNVDISSLTLKTITVLSTLCDEAHELYDVAKYKLIPQIHLFAHDLKHGEEEEASDESISEATNNSSTIGSSTNHPTKEKYPQS